MDYRIFPTTDLETWTDLGLGSFAKRYARPLVVLAQRSFHVDADRGSDLVQGFLLREVERDDPVYALYDESHGHGVKFRTYLSRCFRNYCRDVLRRERNAPAQLRELPATEADAVFEQIALRDLLTTLRTRIVGETEPGSLDARYMDLRWPVDFETEPLSDMEIARALELPRGQIRGIQRRLLKRVLFSIRQHVQDQGLERGDRDAIVKEYWQILERLERKLGM